MDVDVGICMWTSTVGVDVCVGVEVDLQLSVWGFFVYCSSFGSGRHGAMVTVVAESVEFIRCLPCPVWTWCRAGRLGWGNADGGRTGGVVYQSLVFS